MLLEQVIVCVVMFYFVVLAVGEAEGEEQAGAAPAGHQQRQCRQAGRENKRGTLYIGIGTLP